MPVITQKIIQCSLSVITNLEFLNCSNFLSNSKVLSDGEKASIEALTGDNKAYLTIESQGFIFNYSIKTDSETGKKYFNYRLIYAACDTIAKVEGLNIALSSLKGS